MKRIPDFWTVTDDIYRHLKYAAGKAERKYWGDLLMEAIKDAQSHSGGFWEGQTKEADNGKGKE